MFKTQDFFSFGFCFSKFLSDIPRNERPIIAIFAVKGKTNNLNVTFASGTSRFEGRNLIAQKVYVWNRSSNDIIINPIQEITGKISGTGNVICKSRPPKVNVVELYKGRLIFE